MSVAAVLVAAGSGSRLGQQLPKALVGLGGEPIVARAARGLAVAFGGLDEPVAVLVVTAPPTHLVEVSAAVEGLELSVPVVVVPGGATRQGSVAAALAALGPYDADIVLVHDAARPGAPAAMVRRVVDAVRSGHRAVVPAVPVADTVKRVGPDTDGAEPVVETVDRATLRAVQTPQGFDRALLERAHEAAAAHAADESVAASDDAALVELLGEPVWVVAGDEWAAKITTARDLAVAEALLAREDR